MSLVWQTSGGVYQGSLTEHFADFPAGSWATGELSRKPDQVRQFMEGARSSTRANVRSRSRVDTGRMRSEVESVLSGGQETMTLEFGWWEGNPHYAPYQEFGTSRGIQPMLAVHAEFLAVQAALEVVMSS